MKHALILLACCTLSACQAMTAVTSVIGGSVACGASKGDQAFPAEGSFTDISMSFKLSDADVNVAFAHDWRCEYMGSICGGGAWFHVWHAQDTKQTFDLALDGRRQVVVYPHGSCLFVDDYLEECSAGTCEPEEHLGVVFVSDYTRPMHESRQGTTIKGLEQFGIEVHEYAVAVELVTPQGSPGDAR